jgi:hypothetical protein
MPALVAGIHVCRSAASRQDVDGRAKPGHDDSVRFDMNPTSSKMGPIRFYGVP